MGKIFRKSLKFIANTALLGAVYHYWYQYKHYRLKYNLGEESLEPIPHTHLLDLPWLSEDHYPAMMDEIVLPELKKLEVTGKVQSGSDPIHYVYYPLEDARATIVFVHGFNEFKEKYRELYYYFLHAGVEVFAFDLRAHGESKLYPTQSLIDIHSFQEYVNDLDQIIDSVVLPNYHGQELVLMGHSMGGATALSYAEQFPVIFDRVILSSPMLGISTGFIPNSFAHLAGQVMDWVGYGQERLLFTGVLTLGPKLEYIHNPYLTKSEARGKYAHEFDRTHSSATESGATYRWLSESMKATNQIIQPERLERVQVPVLLLRAEEDHLVADSAIFTAGTYLPQVERVLMPAGQHELIFDHDEQLRSYVTRILTFLDLVE